MALRTYILKLSTSSGEMARRVSFEQWWYELHTLKRMYSDSALRKGIQRSQSGEAADTVCNMQADASHDTIIKKFTIIYGNVKTFDLLMRYFYMADQEEEPIPSFVNRTEGLLSRIRGKFPEQIPLHEEQRLLKDRLFHGSQKII